MATGSCFSMPLGGRPDATRFAGKLGEGAGRGAGTVRSSRGCGRIHVEVLGVATYYGGVCVTVHMVLLLRAGKTHQNIT